MLIELPHPAQRDPPGGGRFAARQRERRQHIGAGDVFPKALKQTLSLLKPALSEAELREPRGRLGVQRGLG